MRTACLLVVLTFLVTGCKSEMALQEPVHYLAIRPIKGDVGYYDLNPVLGGGLINGTSNAIRQGMLRKSFGEQGFSYAAEMASILQRELEKSGKTVKCIGAKETLPSEADGLLSVKTEFVGYWKRYKGLWHEHLPVMVVEYTVVNRAGKKICAHYLVSGDDEGLPFLKAYRFTGEFDDIVKAEPQRLLEGLRDTMQRFAGVMAESLADPGPPKRMAMAD